MSATKKQYQSTSIEHVDVNETPAIIQADLRNAYGHFFRSKALEAADYLFPVIKRQAATQWQFGGVKM